jgi:hypothetical protein
MVEEETTVALGLCEAMGKKTLVLWILMRGKFTIEMEVPPLWKIN